MTTLTSDVAGIGKGLSLIVSLVITGVALILLIGAGFLLFYKIDKDSQKEKKDRRIAAGIIAIVAILIIIITWIVTFMVHRSNVMADMILM